jgi:superoxide dismutase, Cu-Zn family
VLRRHDHQQSDHGAEAMKIPSRVACAALALLSPASCGNTIEPEPTAVALIRDAAGVEVGRATFTETGEGVRVRVLTTGVSVGTHGIHVHAAGTCEGPGFASAGGHLNPGGKQHGAHNPAGTHLGDLPNLVVSPGSSGDLTAMLAGATLASPSALFDADGASIVVHAAADDQMTDPSGNSGARIACGVITR